MELTTESQFIDYLRSFATHPAARGLQDDCAVLEVGSETLVITHDSLIEGVHVLPDTAPEDFAWKLAAVNLSDLAAKGAEPLGVLLGFQLSNADWDRRFAVGLKAVLNEYDVPLLGGDTVSLPKDNARSLGLTVFGRATHKPVPPRSGAKPGDCLCVTGNVGDARAGFELANGGKTPPDALLAAYTRPTPLLAEGKALVPAVHAMMDISDGLLLDAKRMAAASGLKVDIDISRIPLSGAYMQFAGDNRTSRIEAASWGDDYQLLFAIREKTRLPVAASMVGQFAEGEGLSIHDGGYALALPEILGYQHS